MTEYFAPEADHQKWWESSTNVPYGTCWCGCGLETKIAGKTRRERFQYEGRPVRYRHGHGGRRSEPVDGHLTCRKCEISKPVSEFYENGHRKNLPHARKYNTICRTCVRGQWLERKYGITQDEYEKLWLEQDGRCAICTEELPLDVDHDHQTNLVRGLLCNACNKGLGLFLDNPTALRSAARYLNPGPIQVLDHGYVELVDCMADDLFVVNSARVSFNKTHQFMEEGDNKLISYLMKNRHGTPFEHAVFMFRIKAPLFVFREWQRHRISSYNEWSARYSKLEPEFYIPNSEHVRSQVGKPGAYTFERTGEEEQRWLRYNLTVSSRQAFESYERAMEMGIAKEQARLFLPVNIYSQMYWTVNARSLMNFLSLRNSEQAMFEIAEYAQVIERIFSELMPVTAAAFVKNQRVAP